jgi:hypothetical protein
VLDNTIAFVEVDDGGPLVRPTGEPEKAVYPVVDANWCKHVSLPVREL